MSAAPLLAARGLLVEYPGVRALDGVDLDLARGEVHALVGENGAGKSTLAAVVCGARRADGGTLALEGRALRLRSPREARDAGIGAVHQELRLVPRLSLAENLFLGRQPVRGALRCVDHRGMEARARELLGGLGLDVDVRRAAAEHPLAVRQMACVARALDLGARVLVLDEPTSSLERGEAAELFKRLRALRERGLGVLVVLHDLEQVEALADRVTVLRNGRRAGTFRVGEVDRLELVRHMLGRQAPRFEALAQEPPPEGARAALVQARGLARAGAIEAFDLDLAPGEVLGLAGLLGAGRSELLRTLFGAEPATAGELRVDGRPARVRAPRDGLRLGFAFLAEDRRHEGLLPSLSVADNVALVARRRERRLRRSRRARAELARGFIARLAIAATPDQPAGTLSGGNQQKVLLARWLAARPRVLLLDEPTRGVDVGARFAIERLVGEAAREGRAVLLASSSLDELARLCARALVLRERRVVDALRGAPLDEGRLLRAMAGAERRLGA